MHRKSGFITLTLAIVLVSLTLRVLCYFGEYECKVWVDRLTLTN